MHGKSSFKFFEKKTWGDSTGDKMADTFCSIGTPTIEILEPHFSQYVLTIVCNKHEKAS